MYFLLKMGIFHCYVILPKGTFLGASKGYPAKNNAWFLILNPSQKETPLAIHSRQCNEIIREAHLSIEMKENLKTRWWDKTVFPKAAKRSLRMAVFEDSCFTTRLIVQEDVETWCIWILWDWKLLLSASQSHANTQKTQTPWNPSMVRLTITLGQKLVLARDLLLDTAGPRSSFSSTTHGYSVPVDYLHAEIFEVTSQAVDHWWNENNVLIN